MSALSPFRIYKLLFPSYPALPAIQASRAEDSATTPAEGEESRPLRIGILGAAAIAPAAVVHPARMIPDKATIIAVAARDPKRAAAFAKKYDIAKIHNTYDELIADEEVDAIYIPLPNGLHYEWTIKCIDKKKPVLLEKPSCSNAEQTKKLFDYAKDKGVLVMEAFHWYFYPAAQYVKDVVSNKEEFGEIVEFEGNLCTNKMFNDDDIRFNYSLAGGSLMDMGCYPISWMRYFVGEEPIAAKKIELEVFPKDAKVDGHAVVEYSFASSERRKAIVRCGLRTPFTTLFKIGLLPLAVIRSEKKTLIYSVPPKPHIFHNISITDNETGQIKNTSCFEEGKEEWTTYMYQLVAFVDAVRGKENKFYSNEDSVLNSQAIDMAYTAIGLPLRM
ncbi:hypothetical protein V1511DRAFT_127231 [Dipodascopsis uninucleata]